ncbi:MSF1-domain-containing protein [Armillaria luteobubalina]|uniref:MSF1-domain-containing protein n=1 Tax=Armillaria luteobubalina TaxID=153913 RepID=A0AA39QPD5_9AGAR|nr:MSF1-domain-containing protein [Armillaria luteobubalina]
MKFYTQSFIYDDPWPIVSLAYFLRYPNPYASHIISCDVISRTQTPSGTLLTTRLILKRGALPRWAPRGIISRSESWVVEESEVDPMGKSVRCTTKNLEFTKVMQVEESVLLSQNDEGKTMQTSEARIRSRFGWGLTKRIETFGMNRFKTHVQRSRDGISLILGMLRQSRLQTLGGPAPYTPMYFAREEPQEPAPAHQERGSSGVGHQNTGPWRRVMGWLSKD